MTFKFAFLWTDILVYILFFVAVGFAIYSSRFEHLRAPWRQVANNKLAMISALVLSGYIIIALCDSIHFQQHAMDENNKPAYDNQGQPVYNPEILSLFDLFVTSMREKTESSYSSPLATRSFSKEIY